MYTTLLDQSGGATWVKTINGSRDGRTNEDAQKRKKIGLKNSADKRQKDF